jgi:hypothetical protein
MNRMEEKEKSCQSERQAICGESDGKQNSRFLLIQFIV